MQGSHDPFLYPFLPSLISKCGTNKALQSLRGGNSVNADVPEGLQWDQPSLRPSRHEHSLSTCCVPVTGNRGNRAWTTCLLGEGFAADERKTQ